MNRKDYEQEFTPTKEEIELFELAKEYDETCDAFDRTVCTGPIYYGSILPISISEMRALNANSRNVIEKLHMRSGYSKEAIRRAIQSYDRRR